MSQSSLAGYYKADIAFYRGYHLLKKIYLRQIFAHLLQAIALTIFIPIDATLLQTGDIIMAAEGIALGAALLSTFILSYQYYLIFQKYSLLGYCQMARDTVHVTNQLIIIGNTQEDCTSAIFVDATSEVRVQGVEERVLDIYAKMARNQISTYVQSRFSPLSCLIRAQTVNGLFAMLIVVIIMVKSASINAAQIAVLTCYLVIQGLFKLAVIIGIIMIALSPLICMVVVAYICCCRKEQGEQRFDKAAAKALPQDVIKCDGQCTICLMDIKPGDDIYNGLPCSQKHIFHKGCLDNWSRVKLTCPTCRKELPIKEGREHHNA